MTTVFRAIFQQCQRFFFPGSCLLLVIFLYFFFIKKDKVAGIVLYLGLIILIDYWMNTALFLPGFSSGSIRYSEFILIPLFLREYRMKNTYDNPVKVKLTKILTVYFFFFFISVVNSNDFMLNLLRNFRELAFSPFVIFWIASRGFDNEKDYHRLCNYLFILTVIIAIGSFQEFFFDHIFMKSIVYEMSYRSQRASHRFGSFFGNPNMCAAFLMLMMPLLLMYIAETRKKIITIIQLFFFLFIFFAAFKTGTRALFLSFPIILMPILFSKTGNYSFTKKIASAFAILLLITILSPQLFTGLFNRVDTINSEIHVEEGAGGDERVVIWVGALKLSTKHIFWGAGFGEDIFVGEALTALDEGFLDPFTATALMVAKMPHNSYIYIHYFMGAGALISFLYFLFIYFKSSFKAVLNNSNYRLYYLNLGIFCSTFGFCMMAFFDYPLFVQRTSATFFCLAGINISLLDQQRFFPQNKHYQE